MSASEPPFSITDTHAVGAEGTEGGCPRPCILAQEKPLSSCRPWKWPTVSIRGLHASRAFLSNKPSAAKLKHPVDDVYLEDLYEPKSYDLDGAIATLKRYAELDYSSPKSVLTLNLDLHLRPMKKGRLQVIFKTTELPHEFDHDNKIGVFTDNQDIIQLALDNGAHAAGGSNFIQKILYGQTSCDSYLCTPEYFKSTVMGHQELAKALKLLTPRKSRGVVADILPELQTLKDDVIISNRSANQTVCKIVVGQIMQPVSELVVNVNAAIAAVREEQNPKHPPIIEGASLICCQETLKFELEEESDVD